MSNLTEDKKFNVELIETPLKEISGTIALLIIVQKGHKKEESTA